jgi:ATP-dependent helicase/nuclease subunit A
LIRKICGSESWKIEDRDGAKGSWRTPRYGDIAILLPVLSHADILEDALRELEIPYVLEGGKFYYARSEVSSAITVLRAVANPNDSVALYGSLRSIFFGLSDQDLLQSHIAGEPLDYRCEVSMESPLWYPYSVLRDLHQNRHAQRASETFEILLQKTGAREVLGARGFQSLANLNKLARTLRTLQEDTTFSQVVDLLSTMDEEGLSESESRLMEERSDAVRVLSIHKSKGLDFPIVFVSGLGQKKLHRSRNLLVELHGEKVFAMRIGSKVSVLQTPRYRELAEKERKRENAELVRLLYVALTRARDYLFLCIHTQDRTKLESRDQWVPKADGSRLAPLSPFLVTCLSENSDLVRFADPKDLTMAARPRQTEFLSSMEDCCSRVEQECKGLRSLIEDTPYSKDLQAAAQSAGINRADEDSAGNGAHRATRLGLAFHEAMETVPISALGSIPKHAADVALRHKLDSASRLTLEEMISMSLNSDLIRRVQAAYQGGKRIFRELPFVRPVQEAAIQEGKIDLLFEEFGGWVLVDYKTDRMPEDRITAEEIHDFFRDTYAGQIQEYVKALQSLSIKVAAAYLLLARTGESVQIL